MSEELKREVIHSELWINTEYFINAFRCVCSLSYLEEHFEICEFINTKDFVDGKLHRFYINLCALVDIHCNYFVSNSKRRNYKKMLQIMCPSFNWIFYERDKNAAHKDSNYVVNLDISLPELIVKMKEAIRITKLICSNVISDKIEYDYYSYDSLLFRYVNGITPELETVFNNDIYAKSKFDEKGSVVFDVISDARQVRRLNQDANYCIICSNGLMGQPYDMMEHRQDMCFNLNALYGTDYWCTMCTKDAKIMSDAFFGLFNLLKKNEAIL